MYSVYVSSSQMTLIVRGRELKSEWSISTSNHNFQMFVVKVIRQDSFGTFDRVKV